MALLGGHACSVVGRICSSVAPAGTVSTAAHMYRHGVPHIRGNSAEHVCLPHICSLLRLLLCCAFRRRSCMRWWAAQTLAGAASAT
jgi:hypothetical protein